jgi:GTPase Era involved in 16S rRNA processing
MSEPISTAITIAKATSATIGLAKKAKELGLLDKLINTFKKKHKILVLGATGVGKTSFIDSITSEFPKAVSRLNRTDFVKTYPLQIEKKIFNFTDTPGQIQHKERRLEAIFQAMKGIDGIINVVSFGYHETKTGKEDALTKSNKLKHDFLEKHRQVEINALNEWTELIGNQDSAKWLITLVNKADLWWNQKDEVLKFYQEGKYFDTLNSAKSLSPITAHYSSVFHRFYDDFPISGSFDDADRVNSKENLLVTLLEAIAKGGLKL